MSSSGAIEMKKIQSVLHHRMVWTLGAALLAIMAVPAIVDVVLKALGLVHGAALHTWPLDVGQNVDGSGAGGSVGSGAGGWPGGKDPYPLIPSGDDGPGSGNGGGSSDPNKPPWWQSWIPSSWNKVGAGPVSIDLTNGHMNVGGSVDLPYGSTGTANVNFGAAPGSDPRGPLVNVTGTVGVETPLGNVEVKGSASVGISQQVQQNLSGPMGSQGTQSGAWLGDFMNGGT